jgi:hypothetical protein
MIVWYNSAVVLTFVLIYHLSKVVIRHLLIIAVHIKINHVWIHELVHSSIPIAFIVYEGLTLILSILILLVFFHLMSVIEHLIVKVKH